MTEKQAPSYPLRMPPSLRDQLSEAAKSSGRSVNAEIITRLEETFKIANPPTYDEFGRFDVDKLHRHMPTELVTQYGLYLYRSELDRVSAMLEECQEELGKAHKRHQKLLAEAPEETGPVTRSKDKLSDLNRRHWELDGQKHRLEEAISAIHRYREASGLPNIRNTIRLYGA